MVGGGLLFNPPTNTRQQSDNTLETCHYVFPPFHLPDSLNSWTAIVYFTKRRQQNRPFHYLNLNDWTILSVLPNCAADFLFCKCHWPKMQMPFCGRCMKLPSLYIQPSIVLSWLLNGSLKNHPSVSYFLFFERGRFQKVQRRWTAAGIYVRDTKVHLQTVGE